MQIEDILEIATWGQLAADPVRSRLYFAESRLNRYKNQAESRIMALDLDDMRVTPFTQGPHDSLPQSSPDGSRLAFLSRRSGSAQIWILPLDGGESYQLTFVAGGVKAFAWAPDNSGMAIIAHIEHGLLLRESPDEEEPGADATNVALEHYYNRDVKHITHQYYKLDGTGFFDEGRDQLVWAGLDGEVKLLTSGFHQYSDPVFAPGGEALFCLVRDYDLADEIREHPHVTHIQRLDWPSAEATRLAIDGLAMSSLVISPDGTQLAFHAIRPEDSGYGLTTLWRWDLKTERLVDLSSRLDRSVGDESGGDVPVASAARPIFWNRRVLTLLSDAGRVGVTAFSEGHNQSLWPADRVIQDFVVSGHWAVLAVSDPTHPSGIIVVDLDDLDDSKERLIWAPTPWDAANGPIEPEYFWATESDGTKVHTWCLLPRGADGPWPLVLEIHGGPMSMYGYRYMHEFQCLAASGYAVVYTNPRGSQGYGRAFCEAIKGQWGDKDYRDVMAGLDQALHRYANLDRERLGVAGGSYGGFMVNWIVSHTNRFSAAVTMRSVVNRFSAMGSSDMGWLRVPQYGSQSWWENPEPYWQQSPLKYASAIDTPLLIEHQEQDQRLPVEQAEQLYSALKYLGRTVELMLYPGESHGMSRGGRPWHRVHRLKSLTAWFDQYLTGRA